MREAAGLRVAAAGAAARRAAAGLA
eukprot:COSAG04_NODE_13829_length_590_cov_12.545825_2_plen_24_part_01